MDRLLVTGGARLAGTLPISGAKNSALKLMAASLLADGTTTLRGIPRIQDCLTMVEVLEHLGAGVAWEEDQVRIDASRIVSVETPYELVRRMRASIVVLGPLLARAHRARVAMPGGDNIGSRPIDLHISGLRKMGALIEADHGYLHAEAPHGLRGASITLDYPSVGATENLMMAAVAARGTTVIDNAAREPEISDIAVFLTSMGARISGAGSSSIEIDGVETFAPVEHTVIADRIEAGTWAIASVATQGDVTLIGARPDHIELLLEKLSETGAKIEFTASGLRIAQSERPQAVDFATLPYPGVATDFQPILMAMLATASGTSIATENVFESRFLYVDELRRMGADIRTEGHHAVIRGVECLSAAPVRALDIRAGAAMIVAALGAEGITEISDMGHVDRGYADLEDKLTSLGAVVTRQRGLTVAAP